MCYIHNQRSNCFRIIGDGNEDGSFRYETLVEVYMKHMSGVPDTPKWSPNEIDTEIEQQPKTGLVQSWFRLTALPTPPPTASFVDRESARKSRLTSTLIFWLLVVFVLFIPGCLALPNRFVIVADIVMMVCSLIAIPLNRTRQQYWAGILLTLAFEAALTMVIFTTQPLDEPSIQQYELFVFGELLCVSLLPASNVFLVMIYNIGIILASLFLQHHTPGLDSDLKTQLIPVIVRPIGVQIMVACVPWLWVRSAAQAIRRADRAEMVAKLEHELAAEQAQIKQGIDQILQTHVEVANGNLNARAPMSEDNVLWQISRALNTLLVRFQRYAQSEQELQRMTHAVNATVQKIQEADLQGEKPKVPFTRTPIDPLIAAMQGKDFEYVPPPSSPTGRYHRG
jgi:hypothetical protein